LRCIAVSLFIFGAAATKALAPVASMAKSKTHKKRSTHKNKAPPKLDLARPIKKPKRLGDFVEMDDAAFEKRVEEGLPLFVGNETLAPFVELARGRVFSLRVVVPMA